MYTQSLSHSQKTIDSVKSVVLYEASVDGSTQPLEVLDLSNSRVVLQKAVILLHISNPCVRLAKPRLLVIIVAKLQRLFECKRSLGCLFGKSLHQ